jgi:hypothetical protein
MVTAGSSVARLSKAVGRQVFLNGKMRELYHFSGRGSTIDDGKQTGACRQHRVYWIFQPPTLIKFGNGFCLEVECEQLGEFLYAKRAGSDCNKLKQTMGEFPVCLIDLSQAALISLFQRLWQVGQRVLDTRWDAATDVD